MSDEWKGGGTDRRRNPERVKELEQQLAAEREIHEAAVRASKHAINELHKQLAAEREVGHNQAVTLGQHIARLEDQLAAEREKLKEALDLLTR